MWSQAGLKMKNCTNSGLAKSGFEKPGPGLRHAAIHHHSLHLPWLDWIFWVEAACIEAHIVVTSTGPVHRFGCWSHCSHEVQTQVVDHVIFISTQGKFKGTIIRSLIPFCSLLLDFLLLDEIDASTPATSNKDAKTLISYCGPDKLMSECDCEVPEQFTWNAKSGEKCEHWSAQSCAMNSLWISSKSLQAR